MQAPDPRSARRRAAGNAAPGPGNSGMRQDMIVIDGVPAADALGAEHFPGRVP